MLDYFGVVASDETGATANGILSSATVDDGIKVGLADLTGNNLIFSYLSTSLPNLSINKRITINGKVYIVQNLLISHLGEWSKAYLREE